MTSRIMLLTMLIVLCFVVIRSLANSEPGGVTGNPTVTLDDK
ncbi:MAG: hypothetical protein ABSA97_07095 [Verrucomicrobiia bacterium]